MEGRAGRERRVRKRGDKVKTDSDEKNSENGKKGRRVRGSGKKRKEGGEEREEEEEMKTERMGKRKQETRVKEIIERS